MITKIGKEAVKDNYAWSLDTVKEIGANIVKGTMLSKMINLAGTGSTFISTQDPKMKLTDSDFEKLKKSMGSTATRVQSTNKGLHAALQAGYNYKDNTVNPGNTLAAAAHELGHASGFKGYKYMPMLFLKNLKIPANIMAARAGMLDRKAKDHKLTKTENLERRAADILQYSAAPILAEETRASIRGLRHLYKTHGKDAALRAAPYLLAALGTYAAKAATPFMVRRLARNTEANSKDPK